MAKVSAQDTPIHPHTLTLSERQNMQLTGIEQVLAFDDKQLLLQTSKGNLAISGEGIHITSLLLEDGRLSFDGRVDALSYSDQHTLRRAWRSWFK